MENPGPRVSDPRPLLAFPAPESGAIPRGDRPPFRPVQTPSPSRQGERLSPQFQRLQDALTSDRAELTKETASPEPELVAVFDLAGSVDTFLRATAHIEGLEFLADLREEYVDPDDDFYYVEEGEASDAGVPQSLYMVMSSARAVTELVRLFELWQQDLSITFERGLNPLKDVFVHLRAIRRWGPEDRVRETGLLDRWREDVEVVGAQGNARVEIELWYRTDPATRRRVEFEVAGLVRAAHGAVVSTSDLDQIGYHSILADIPYSEVERVLARGPDAIELLRAEHIMLVGPSVPMAFPTIEPVEAGRLTFDEAEPAESPRVALLDGVPLANHRALVGRLVLDDPDGHASRYTAATRSHGSAMASIIAHGDLSDPEPALSTRIYVRPILQPHEAFPGQEVVPPDELLVDVVHRAFQRMYGGERPKAPSVRIVNLSIGDPARVFVRRLSPLARLLDWLAHEYNLLIVVSGGNPTSRPVVPASSLDDPEGLPAAALRSLHEQARHRRLLSPAEAINVITVGATHDDRSDEALPETVLDVLDKGLPAPYSPAGFGYRRAVKPDVLLPGGRQVFGRPPPDQGDEIELREIVTRGRGPGIRVAAPSSTGDVDATAYTTGTSNAAAFATRTASTIFDVLEGASNRPGEPPFPNAQYHPVLAKALLVHAAGWHDLRDRMQQLLDLSGREVRRELTRLLGYGPVRQDRVVNADRVRVVLLGASSIDKDQRHTFRFPLPTSLAASKEWRRLTISLAWLSPLNMRSQKYRMARLWFSPPRDDLGVDPVEGYHHAVDRGTVQHEVLEGDKAVAFTQGDDLVIDIDCRCDAGTSLPQSVRYGLVASLEISATVLADIHDEVRTALRARVRERAQVATQG